MSVSRHNPVADLGTARAALADLCAPFVPDGFVAECEVISPDAIPVPADALLVHHNHMTVALERHYGKAVQVHVLEEHLDEHTYTRKIYLTLDGTSQVVEWGIARLHLKYLSPEVRAEVLGKQTPLGAILIRHNVHRRIKPRYFVRFPAHNRVIALFGAGSNSFPVYGRLGTIFCNDEPAIELLEIVVNTQTFPSPGTPGEAG
jgi:chorismate-pyruvate lyase